MAEVRLAKAVAAVLLVAAGPCAAREKLAQRILGEAGVKGGLIVHLGCGDPGAPGLTAALRAGDGYLVHGLDRDVNNVAKAREHIRKLGLYGPVSVEHWAETYLPYADDLVNLLIVGDTCGVTREEMMRVLAPNGVAYVRTGGR